MYKRIFIYVTVLLFAGFAFYLWNSSEGPSKPQSAADIDSVAADNRPSISEEEEHAPPEEQRLSPGTAHVGSLTLMDDLENHTFKMDMKSETSYSVSRSSNTLYINSE